MPLSHYFHIQCSVIIEINVSIFFLAQQASWKMWLNCLLSISCPLGCWSRCFPFFFSLCLIYKNYLKKRKEKKKKRVGSMNFAKLDFNWELQQVVEKQGWFSQQSGGGTAMTWNLFYTTSCHFWGWGEWSLTGCVMWWAIVWIVHLS